ncbi:MAG: hypothetical protein H2057_02510 [Alphaproteobacteria bacterium]|nr:hypothetical protein [Alphaproteobacteria bacterium]
MKNLMYVAMVVFSASSLVASNLEEEDYRWTRTFTLVSGLEITHTEDNITCGGMTFNCSFKNSKGSNFMGIKLMEDQELKPQLSIEAFRKEVLKLGPIAWER